MRLGEENRIGEFEIEHRLIEDACLNPAHHLHELFMGMIILRCESLLYKNTMSYTAWSRFFEPVPMDGSAPFYEFHFHFHRPIHQLRAEVDKITVERIDHR